MATSVLGSTPGKLLVLCVLTSTAASCQTTIMPTARAVLAMSAHGAIGKWFARMHPRFRTPTTATVVMGAVSALFYVLLTTVSKNVLADSAASVGLLIAFYYGLTPGAAGPAAVQAAQGRGARGGLPDDREAGRGRHPLRRRGGRGGVARHRAGDFTDRYDADPDITAASAVRSVMATLRELLRN